jgi:hypothetical protein
MAEPSDRDPARELGAKCLEARSMLESHMLERGLRLEDGWRIHEQVRHHGGRTVIVMTPIHTRLTAPADLACSCSIDAQGSDASADCGPVGAN